MPFPNPLTQAGVFTYDARDAVNYLLASQGILTQGNIWWVRPRVGPGTGAGGDGKSPGTAFKTVAEGLAAATADQNDVVLLCAESNTAGSTTDYQSATLTWNKNMVHLIGVNHVPQYSSRSRIAFLSTYNTASNLFTVSASNCLIKGVEFFAGVAGTLPTGAVKVTGTRNVFRNCHIVGIGADTNDIASAYSLYCYGGGENLYEDCAIGLDTIAAGTAANSELLFDGATPGTATFRNTFRRCQIYRLIEHATNHPLVKIVGATSIDKSLTFEQCLFLSTSTNYAYAQAGVFKLGAVLTQGFIHLINCYCNRSDKSTAVKWDVDDRNQIAVSGAPLPVDDNAGMSLMV